MRSSLTFRLTNFNSDLPSENIGQSSDAGKHTIGHTAYASGGYMVKLGSISLLCLALASCTTNVYEPTSGDRVPERALDQAGLLNTFALEGDWHRSEVLEAPEGATRLGVLLTLSESASADTRVRLLAQNEAGESADVHYTWAEHPTRTGFASFAQVTHGVTLSIHKDDIKNVQSLVFSAVIPQEPEVSNFDHSFNQPVANVNQSQKALAISNVVSRAQWGARASRCTNQNRTKSRITIHHTVSPVSPQPAYENNVRGIQAYHMDSRGWCDVGYHFLVTADGRAFEAREAHLLGAHVGGQNTGNVGISMIGCFHTSGCSGLGATQPPAIMVDRVAELVAQNASHYGISISANTVMGHRDNPGQSTSCPGNNVHSQLDEIRAAANGQEVGGDEGNETSPGKGRVQGIVWDLSLADSASESEGARLSGVQVTCGDCGEQAVTREGDAFWSIEVNPGNYTFTASLDGFDLGSQQVQVNAGGQHWASMGIAPSDSSAELTLFVIDRETGAPILNASAQATGNGIAQTATDGSVSFVVNAGAVLLSASAEGYLANDKTIDVLAGDDLRETLMLERIVVEEEEPIEEEPGEEEPGEEVPNGEAPEGEEPYQEQGPEEEGAPSQPDAERDLVHIAPNSSGLSQAMCECISGDSDASEPTMIAIAAFLALGGLGRRRRR